MTARTPSTSQTTYPSHRPTQAQKLYRAVLILGIAALLGIIFLETLEKRFNHDEFEHIHSAWLISIGKLPYADFYQNHNPLFWYTLLPFLGLFGETTTTPIVLRVVMFILTLGIVYQTYRLAREATGSWETAFYAVLLLLPVLIFIQKSVEIRPDVPQVLCGLLSIFFLLRFTRRGGTRDLLYSGLWAGVSFVFLQKSVFLLLAYAGIFFIWLVRRDLRIRDALFFALPLAVPLACLLLFLLLTGIWGDYVLTSWKLHMSYTRFSPLKYFLPSLEQNPPFWGLGILASFLVLLWPRTGPALRITAFLGLALLSSVLFVGHPHRQYFLFAIPLLAIPAAHVVTELQHRLKLHWAVRLVVLAALVAFPARSLLGIGDGSNHKQLERIDFILRNSDPSDLIHDGDIQFNLYREDLHYFWYSLGKGKGLDVYNRLTKNRYGDYDTCELILAKKPKFIFIADYAFRGKYCDLRRLYEPTTYLRLYVLKGTSTGWEFGVLR